MGREPRSEGGATGVLRAVPKGWFSYNFDVYDRTGERVGRAELSRWHENAILEVGGARYEATHKRGRKEFVLSREDGTTVVVAEKPSAWKERFSFVFDGVGYELRKESAWRRAFVLSREGVGAVGSIRPGSTLKREWTAELPGDLPIEVRVFVMWLAALLWKRKDAAGGAATAGDG
jgi:hypothetical protein